MSLMTNRDHHKMNLKKNSKINSKNSSEEMGRNEEGDTFGAAAFHLKGIINFFLVTLAAGGEGIDVSVAAAGMVDVAR